MPFSPNDYNELVTLFSVANIEEKILESGKFFGNVHISQSTNAILYIGIN